MCVFKNFIYLRYYIIILNIFKTCLYIINYNDINNKLINYNLELASIFIINNMFSVNRVCPKYYYYYFHMTGNYYYYNKPIYNRFVIFK